jgi:hypothetical protein
MEPDAQQDGTHASSSSAGWRKLGGVAIVLLLLGLGLRSFTTGGWQWLGATVSAFCIVVILVWVVALAVAFVTVGLRDSEKEARDRLRQAEQQLAQSLGQQLDESPKQDGQTSVNAPTGSRRAARAAQDRLTLSVQWQVTHSRLDLYHQIATTQARRSFLTAQVAIGAGFALLIAFAVLATRTQTTAGAITTAALGAVSAALAGYISRTFVRSQESAAAHLRAYFDQPLDFAKYLAAERLLTSNADLDDDKRAAIVTSLVQAIVAPSPPDGGTAP